MSYVQEMVAYEGKVFQVDLQSMLGSSPYGWALSKLPEGIVLEGVETIRQTSGFAIAPVIQRFYLGVTAVKEYNVQLEFLLLCSFAPKQIADSCTITLRIVPENANQFAAYSDNAAVQGVNIPSGANAIAQNVNVEYGYPCAATNAALAYGYPCTLKYGYACASSPSPATDYGLPDLSAGAFANNAMPYGYISAGTEKYGYPCVMTQSNALYGYAFDCVNNQNQAVSTPFLRKATPFLNPGSPIVTDAPVKYGYPTCV